MVGSGNGYSGCDGRLRTATAQADGSGRGRQRVECLQLTSEEVGLPRGGRRCQADFAWGADAAGADSVLAGLAAGVSDFFSEAGTDDDLRESVR